ncbi:putative phosphatidate phosphatase [Anastrepha obliqua]|uniref:putative phosphatidate phosphatase n=1 Tax=Anastrepha obliqua TaxID=95512 RepID=UPI00240A86DF|nr:putative phosphatidate phosphatase [Anastrepha obliqua]XP_054738815.1 putative phosphatidate phosphatase [Anastrepha obliqua]XP_054738816.1 putative phosphatidate phosphatase [Anastrepha obliqua]
MNSLRPTSISDAALLQRLESQSSNSEPSSPTLQAGAPQTSVLHIRNIQMAKVDTTATRSQPLPINNTQYKNNNNLALPFPGFMNDGGGSSGLSKITKTDYRNGVGKICCRIGSDLIILACVALPVLAFQLWGVSYKRGFFCDDKTLKHPYKRSTVSNWMLFVMCFIVPISIITAVEFFVSHYNRSHGLVNKTFERYYIGRLEIADWIVECYKKIGLLIFGSGVGQLTMDIAKYTIGRLRPHFSTVCQPVLADGSTCNDAFNAGRYVQEFSCAGNATPRMLKQMHLSFPSSHACFACFTMIYMTIYLENRMTWRRCKMLRHFIQFLLLMFAWYTGLTRVSDYQHHPTDVFAGSAIGALYAILLMKTMC